MHIKEHQGVDIVTTSEKHEKYNNDMSLLNLRERKLSRSDGDLSARTKSSIPTINENENETPSDNRQPLTHRNHKQENKTKRRKENANTKTPMTTRLLSNSNNKRKRKKESFFPRRFQHGTEDANENIGYMLRRAVRTFDTRRVLKLLDHYSININESNEMGVTALHEAAIDGNLVCMNILVNHEANINVTDNEGFTPLDYTVFAGNFECASYLIERGAHEDRIRDGQIVCKQRHNRSISFC